MQWCPNTGSSGRGKNGENKDFLLWQGMKVVLTKVFGVFRVNNNSRYNISKGLRFFFFNPWHFNKILFKNLPFPHHKIFFCLPDGKIYFFTYFYDINKDQEKDWIGYCCFENNAISKCIRFYFPYLEAIFCCEEKN